MQINRGNSPAFGSFKLLTASEKVIKLANSKHPDAESFQDGLWMHNGASGLVKMVVGAHMNASKLGYEQAAAAYDTILAQKLDTLA